MKLRMILIATLFAAACGSKSKGTSGGGGTTPTGGGGGGPGAALAAGKWEAMNHDERKEFMEHVVKPTMEPLFKGFDKDRFADFGCRTCHGKGVDSKEFKMPNPDLPELSMDLLKNPPDDDKAILPFMEDTVKPKMAELLGLPPYTPENPTGFGCAECHPFKM